MFASEAFLGVRAAHRVTYCCIASPAGPYFASGVQAGHDLDLHHYTRAAPGGTGAAKCGGNYAASLIAQKEAAQQGCDQVMFADAAEHAWVEELGGMNVYLVTTDNELVTPELTGSILEGVTRDSILTLAQRVRPDPGRTAGQRAELLEGVRSGRVSEVFACGTAAVITPIGSLQNDDGHLHGRRRGRPGSHDGAAQGPARHPVRPGSRQPRVASPGLLSGRPAEYRNLDPAVES